MILNIFCSSLAFAEVIENDKLGDLQVKQDGTPTPYNDALSRIGVNSTQGIDAVTYLQGDINSLNKSFQKTTEEKGFWNAITLARGSEDNSQNVNKALDNLWKVVHDILTWLIAFGMISAVLVCLFNFIKMATAPSHPMQRRNCMESIVISLICIVLLGGLGTVLQLFYGTFAESLSSGLVYMKDWRYPATFFLTQYGNLIAGFSGIASLTMLLCLGFCFTKLAMSGGNPQKKTQAITGIATTTVATIGVGGITTFVSYLAGLINL